MLMISRNFANALLHRVGQIKVQSLWPAVGCVHPGAVLTTQEAFGEIMSFIGPKI